MRLDQFLQKNKHTESRSKAQALIKAGDVFVNEKKIVKPSTIVHEGDNVSITDTTQYVSRAAHKLLQACEAFDFNVEGIVALDIGSSTGGFTEILLEKGAQKVFSLDVGTGQLHPRLKEDSHVVSMEQTDFRSLAKLPSEVTHVVIDVSFTSIQNILEHIIHIAQTPLEIVALIKPQFEVESEKRNKQGVVKDINESRKVLKKVTKWSAQQGFFVNGSCESPIVGKHGNTEFLLHLTLKP